MKNKLILLVLAAVVVSCSTAKLGSRPRPSQPPLPLIGHGVRALPPSGWISLAWDYPSNDLSADLSFVVVATNNLGPFPWPSIANPTAASSISPTYWDGSNFSFSVPVQIQPGAMFFACYASNFWGTSTMSTTASTPPLPLQVGPLGITRTN